MPTRFRAYQPDQKLLMPVKLNDWVPEGHLARQVSDVVDDLDLSAFYARHEGDGRRNAPYSPVMMVKVLIYGYATGCFRLGSWCGSWRRTLRFGCWRRGTFRTIGRSASSGGVIWRTFRRCS